MSKFDQNVKEIAIFIRSQLNQVEDISSINFEISIDGRNHDGELNIEYKLGSNYGTGWPG